MMRIKRPAIVLCLLCAAALLCSCGTTTQPEETAASQVTETQPVTEIPTEPQPVYETQTVYLCVEEHHQNYEGGSFRNGYTYDEFGRVTEYFQIKDDGSRGWVTEYSYDENGNNIERRTGDSVSIMTYDESGRLLSELFYSAGECKNEEYFVYDAEGFLVERTEISRYTQEVTYHYMVTYHDDHTQAQIDEVVDGEPNGKTLETYNSDGKVLTSDSYDRDGNWKRSLTWEYDEAGRLVLEGHYSRSETQADYMVIYTYDENGLLLSKNVDYYYGYLQEYIYEPFEILVRVK